MAPTPSITVGSPPYHQRGGAVRTGGSEIETRARNKKKMTKNYRDKYRNKEPGTMGWKTEPGNRDRSLGQYPGKTWKQGQEPGTGTRNRN